MATCHSQQHVHAKPFALQPSEPPPQSLPYLFTRFPLPAFALLVFLLEPKMSCIIKFSNVNKDNRWRACRATRASRPTTSIKLTWANKPSTLAAEAKASPEPEVAALQQPATQHYHLFDPAWLSEQAYAKLGYVSYLSDGALSQVTNDDTVSARLCRTATALSSSRTRSSELILSSTSRRPNSTRVSGSGSRSLSPSARTTQIA